MYLDAQASKVYLGASGQKTKVLLPLDVDKIVTSANMKNGAYTIAAQPAAPCRITLTHTAVGAADTLGTVVIVGTLYDNTVVQEIITPVASSTVSTVNEFKSITSATGVGWTIGEGNDTLTIGVGEVVPGSYYFQAVANRIVASTNMKVGAYTVAAQPFVPSKITVLATAAGATDTMGTITINGVVNGVPTAEAVTPIAGTTVTTVNTFSSVYSVVGAGWVIGEGNDTIVVGTAEVREETQYYICNIQVLSAAVVSSQTARTGTVADLTKFTSIPVGVYPTNLSAIKLTSGEALVFLQAI